MIPVAGHVTALVKAQSHDSRRRGFFSERCGTLPRRAVSAHPMGGTRRAASRPRTGSGASSVRGGLSGGTAASPSLRVQDPTGCLNGTTVFENGGVAGPGRQGGLQGEGMRQGVPGCPSPPLAGCPEPCPPPPTPGAPSPVTTCLPGFPHQSGFPHIPPHSEGTRISGLGLLL